MYRQLPKKTVSKPTVTNEIFYFDFKKHEAQAANA